MNRMNAVTPVFLCLTSLSLCRLLSASEAVTKSAKPGETITLPCNAPPNSHVSAVQWTRLDLKQYYVYFCRDGRPDPTKQHQLFRDRVELNCSQPQNDDLSLSLKDVRSYDNGTYKCRVIPNRMKRDIIDTEPISTVTLKIVNVFQSEPGGGENNNGGDKHGHVGLVAVVSVLLVGFILGGFVWVYRKPNRLSEQSYQAATSGSSV